MPSHADRGRSVINPVHVLGLRTIDQDDVSDPGERAAGLEDEGRVRISTAIQRQVSCDANCAPAAVDTGRLRCPANVGGADDSAARQADLLVLYNTMVGLRLLRYRVGQM